MVKILNGTNLNWKM